jgi:hypothetical protein
VAVDAPETNTVILLKMVRSEAGADSARLVERLEAHFPGMRVVWLTTAQGLAVLQKAACPVEARLLVDPPGGLRRALAALRAQRTEACVIGYDDAERRGNLALEVCALVGRARRLYWTTDGESIQALPRGVLTARVAAGLVVACGLGVVGLLGGLLAAMLLPWVCLFTSKGRKLA